jgi:hypothetical protein
MVIGGMGLVGTFLEFFLMGNYDDLTGGFVTDAGVETHGAASMTTQIFERGGLKKVCEEAHLRGFSEGYREGFESGYEVGLAEKVDLLVAAAIKKHEMEQSK